MNSDQKIIRFTVPGDPKSLKRHRTFRRGNFVGQYDPSKTDKADFLAKCMQYKPNVPWEGPLILTVIADFPRPKSHFRAGKHSNELKPGAPNWHTSRPDASNILKFVEDALNGIFWKDDSCLSEVTCIKYYSPVPCLKIELGVL